MDKEKRIKELEKKAKEMYLENTDWSYIISILDPKEEKEYYDLYDKLYG